LLYKLTVQVLYLMKIIERDMYFDLVDLLHSHRCISQDQLKWANQDIHVLYRLRSELLDIHMMVDNQQIVNIQSMQFYRLVK
jgi:hypothetical protein